MLQEIDECKKRILLTKQIPGTVIPVSPLLLEKSLNNLIKLNIVCLETSKLEGLDNKQLILNLSLDQMSKYINENKSNWPQFVSFLYDG